MHEFNPPEPWQYRLVLPRPHYHYFHHYHNLSVDYVLKMSLLRFRQRLVQMLISSPKKIILWKIFNCINAFLLQFLQPGVGVNGVPATSIATSLEATEGKEKSRTPAKISTVTSQLGGWRQRTPAQIYSNVDQNYNYTFMMSVFQVTHWPRYLPLLPTCLRPEQTAPST